MTTEMVSLSRSAAPSKGGLLALAGAGVAGGALAGMAAGAGASGFAAACVIGAVAATAGWTDLRERRIPDRVVLAGLAATTVVALVFVIGGDRQIGGSVGAGGAVAGGLLLALHLVRPVSLGFGDVKLATVLGAVLGIVHWSLAAVMLGLASLSGTIGAAVLPAWRRSIPFGTCMGVASVAAIAATPVLRDRVGLW